MAHARIHEHFDGLGIWCNVENLVVDRLATVIARVSHHANYIIGLEAELNLIYPGRNDQLLLQLDLLLRFLAPSTASYSIF